MLIQYQGRAGEPFLEPRLEFQPPQIPVLPVADLAYLPVPMVPIAPTLLAPGLLVDFQNPQLPIPPALVTPGETTTVHADAIAVAAFEFQAPQMPREAPAPIPFTGEGVIAEPVLPATTVALDWISAPPMPVQPEQAHPELVRSLVVEQTLYTSQALDWMQPPQMPPKAPAPNVREGGGTFHVEQTLVTDVSIDWLGGFPDQVHEDPQTLQVPASFVPFLARTTYTQTQYGNFVTIRANNPEATTDTVWHWYVDGEHVLSTKSNSYTHWLDDGEQVTIVAIPTTDASFNPITSAPVGYTARRTIEWIRSEDSDVKNYRVEYATGQATPAAADWLTWATVPEDGRWSYQVQSPRMDDLTYYWFRVTPVSTAGNDGTALTQGPFLMVRIPDVPNYNAYFDQTNTFVRFEAASPELPAIDWIGQQPAPQAPAPHFDGSTGSIVIDPSLI